MSLFFILSFSICFPSVTYTITSTKCSTGTSARCTTSVGVSSLHRKLPDGEFQNMSWTVTGLRGQRGSSLAEIHLSWYLPDPVLSKCRQPLQYSGFNLTFEARDRHTFVKSTLQTIFTIILNQDGGNNRQISVNVSSDYFTTKVYIEVHVTTNIVPAEYCVLRQATTSIVETVKLPLNIHDFTLRVSPGRNRSVSIRFTPLNISDFNTVALCESACPSSPSCLHISHQHVCKSHILQKMYGYLKIEDIKSCQIYSIKICPSNKVLPMYCDTFFIPSTEFPCSHDPMTTTVSTSNTHSPMPFTHHTSQQEETHLTPNYTTSLQAAMGEPTTRMPHDNKNLSGVVSTVAGVNKAYYDKIVISAVVASLIVTAFVITAAAVVVIKQRSKQQIMNEVQVEDDSCGFNISNCAIVDGSVGVILFFCTSDVDQVSQIVCACRKIKIVLNHIDICDETFAQLHDYTRISRHHRIAVFVGSWMMVKVLESRRSSTSEHTPADTVRLVKRHFAKSYLLCLNSKACCIGRLQTLLNVSVEQTFIFSNNDPSISKLLKEVLFSPPDETSDHPSDSDEDIFVELASINYRSSWP